MDLAGDRKCRFCGEKLHLTFVNLGMSPLCESFLSVDQLNKMEPFYPLHVFVCDKCFLVQLEEYVSPEHIFTEYAYFSSYSDTWLQHCKSYTQAMTERLQLGKDCFVIEIASNDGYLLQFFLERNIPVLGIEPAKNVAKDSINKGIPTMVEFFSSELAMLLRNQEKQADLIIGNNVLAQVPTLNDFVEGMKILLKPQGVITMEFPHLMHLIAENQFDTIYHEHFSYFSFITAEKLFTAHDLVLFDVDELSTHGGSLRIYARHAADTNKPVTERVSELRARENDAGIANISHYSTFSEQVRQTKRNLLSFLIEAKSSGKKIAGYGAPGKGNTMLNYCGVRTDFLDYTVDRNPHKHGKFLPGTHIPIYPPEKIRDTKPDFVLILPWNFKDEIMNQMSYIREWGGQFVVAVPELKIYP